MDFSETRVQLVPVNSLAGDTCSQLRQRLDKFYAGCSEYLAFQEPSNQMICWAHVIGEIQRRLQRTPGTKVKVLEVGAGRTGFALALSEAGLRSSVDLHTQDVTDFNESWLRKQADQVYIGDVSRCGLPADFDVIFSTYVLEHVTDPVAHLNVLWKSLRSGDNSRGALFLFSPRYDLPGYVCPSASHLGPMRRLGLVATSLCWRLWTLVSRRASFLIQTDLAVFYRPFFIDSDAVHWVSAFDLRAWSKNCGASFESLRVGEPKKFTKDWVIKRFCTLAVKISH